MANKPFWGTREDWRYFGCAMIVIATGTLVFLGVMEVVMRPEKFPPFLRGVAFTLFLLFAAGFLLLHALGPFLHLMHLKGVVEFFTHLGEKSAPKSYTPPPSIPTSGISPSPSEEILEERIPAVLDDPLPRESAEPWRSRRW